MKKWIYNALIVFFALMFLVSAGMLIAYFIEGQQQKDRYEDLSSLKGEGSPRPSVLQSDDTAQQERPVELVEFTDPETGKTVSMLPEFKDLYLQNNDIIGWLKIPGTVIDYPVMQSGKDDPDYYLYRNFDKENNKRGCLYVWPENDVNAPSDNITIYGHHMRDGSMFAALKKYRKSAFRKENPYIYFDTLTELHTYEVMAVFLTTASVGEGFEYHNFIDAQSEKEFNDFVAQCKKLSLYKTGVDAKYGDKLICLSTCEYSQTNGRLVVVAKRIA